MYVDDLVVSLSKRELIRRCLKEAQLIFEKGGFELHKIHTNLDNEQGQVKVLGLSWDLSLDTLAVVTPKVAEGGGNTTRRVMVREAASVFDPLGLVSPIVIHARIIIQKSWALCLQWDDVIPAEMSQEWQEWRSLLKIEEWVVPRHVFQGLEEEIDLLNVEMHFFADASPKAYGAVVYVTYDHPRDGRSSTLVMSKFRLAPLKALTLPNLELLAAVMAGRLSIYLEKNCVFKPKKKFFWSDSQITLHRIRGRKFNESTYVNNRLGEIAVCTEANQWFYCRTHDNPADVGTREVRRNQAELPELWWRGPQWMVTEELVAKLVWEGKPIEDKGQKVETVLLTSEKTEKGGISEVMNVNRFSSWSRLIRCTKAVVQAVGRFKKVQFVEEPIVLQERAVLWWLLDMQSRYFREDIDHLRRNSGGSSKLRTWKLKPFFDQEGLMRCLGRLQLGNFSYNQKHPILLAPEAEITPLIIMNVHRELWHAGVGTTLITLRQKFWLIRGKQTVRKVLYKCGTCRRWTAQPIKQPVAPLPWERIEMTTPFTTVGIDYAGPIYLLENQVVEKAYIVVFACATSRAVHLEVVTSLSTDAFLLAFRRFISRRGVPSLIMSDNAAQFKRAAKDLNELKCLESAPVVASEMEKKKIKWRRIVERAPWWGGFWERMVSTLKDPLKKILGAAVLNYEQWETTLVEVEAVINSRPLAAVSEELDCIVVITPAMLLIGRPLQQLESYVPPTANGDVVQQFVYRRKLLNQLIERWRDEYLLQLRSAFYMENRKKQDVEVGTVVLVMGERNRRHLWPLARIEECFEGRDGVVRSCLIRMSDGRRFRRAVDHLIPLVFANLAGGQSVKNSPEGSSLREEDDEVEGSMTLRSGRILGKKGDILS